MKKRVIICLVLVIVLVGIIYIIHSKRMEELDGGYQSEGETNIDLGNICDDVVWQNGILIGKNIIIYNDNLLGYNDLQSGRNGILCSKSGCMHNTEDCMASITLEGATAGMYFYKNKLYILNFNSREVAMYRCDIDGGNHEKFTKINIDMTDYDTVEDVAFMEGDNGIFIGVILGNEGQCSVLEDGSMSDWSTVGKIFYMDYSAEKTDELATLESGYGGYFIFHSIEDNKLYFEYQNDKLPQEERDEADSTDLSYIAYLDMGDKSVNQIENRQLRDYIGYKDGVTYINKYDDEYNLTGEVVAINYSNGNSEIITIDEAVGINLDEGGFSLLEDGLAFNDNSGTYIYDLNGNKLNYVKSEWFNVVGEYNDFYLIAPKGNLLYYASGYVAKENVDEIDDKYVLLGAEKE